ncbi:MAG: GNAT family N-acetyltransferase [Chitinophagaceae bacterium]|nr:GNAT family N-acetyltransferase [Chitinophagaceae bacterium]
MLQLDFSPFPVLTTERLLLRKLTAEDEQGIFALRTDDIVNKYLDRIKARSVEDARKFIQKVNNSIDSNELIYWGICLRPKTRIIGTVCFWNIAVENDKAEIGYELLPACQGQGLMQEALSAIIDYGFTSMRLATIEAVADLQNERSVKLLEKIGFKKEGNKKDILPGNDNTDNMIVYRLNRQ